MDQHLSVEKPFIIAEAGVNHNGDLNLAYELIKQAKACGAHAVKFQTFKTELLAQQHTPKVPYQTVDAPDEQESHFDMLKKLELDEEQTQRVKKCCDQEQIEFMSTPYDPASVTFLQRIGSQRIKIASADLVDFQIQEALRSTGLPVIQSVGMATLEEIDHWNRAYLEFSPGYPRTILQCTSNYPSDPYNANLRVMERLKHRYQIPVGFSDHTPDERAAVLSVACGATIIEKHFTLNKTMPGPDHKASADPHDLKLYCAKIQEAHLIMGSSKKQVAKEELNMRNISRKGVFLKKNLAKGHALSLQDVYFSRPGNQMNMHQLQTVLGKKLILSLKANDALSMDHMEHEP